MARVAAVVGLSIERTILQLRSVAFQPPAARWVAAAGADATRAEALADHLIRQGATAMLSFGIAGGLDPAANPGLLVLASDIVLPDGTHLPTDSAWRARLAQILGGPETREGPIAGSDRMLTAINRKADLYRQTGAIAADMESHGIARAAARHAIPFLAVRAIADPANRALPASVAAGLDAFGTIRPLSTIAALLASPRELSALLGVTADFARALAALWRFAGHAGPNLQPAS